MTQAVNNFTVFESIYGRFVVNRNCYFQAEALAKTGKPHINDELEKLLAVVRTLPPGAICVDAGANIGLVAIPMAQALRQQGGSVLAFEVQRMMFYALCGAAALNDLENLFAFHAGLGAAARSEMLSHPDYSKPQDFGTFSLLQDSAKGNERIEIVTVDSLKLPRLDLLKIDVEGMELEVLKGARESIERHRPWCWVEYWIIGADKIKEAFAAFPDYELVLMDKLNLLCVPREKREASGLTIRAPVA
jgi:FkbM family methyltransferase